MLSSPVSKKSCCLSQPATHMNCSQRPSEGVGAAPFVKLPTCQCCRTGGGTVRKACSQSPSPLHPLKQHTQADQSSVMAGAAARWHLPNSRGMPLSLTAPPCPLQRRTRRLNWAESRLPDISKTKREKLLSTCDKVSSGLIFLSYLPVSGELQDWIVNPKKMLNVDLESPQLGTGRFNSELSSQVCVDWSCGPVWNISEKFRIKTFSCRIKCWIPFTL